MQTNISDYFGRTTSTPKEATAEVPSSTNVKPREKRPLDETPADPTRNVRAASPPVKVTDASSDPQVAPSGSPAEHEHELSALPVSDSTGPCWDSKDSTRFVKFPCAPRCIKRWSIVRETLQTPVPQPLPSTASITNDQTQITDASGLIAAIFVINPSRSKSWDLTGLHTYFMSMEPADRKHFFSKTLPVIANMALELPRHLEELTAPIPLLLAGTEDTVSMSRQLCSSLMALAFFCAVPAQGGSKSSIRVINFAQLYQSHLSPGSSQGAKLQCLLHYLQRTAASPPAGLCTLQRTVVDTSEIELTELAGGFDHTTVTVLASGCIEETAGTIHVNFANKSLGGGVLGRGSVQEEIRWCISPELFMSRFLCAPMGDNEAVVQYGTERYCTYKGYAATFAFGGDFQDPTERRDDGTPLTAVLALDATDYSKCMSTQYSEEGLEREALKVMVGFSADDERFFDNHRPAIATGNWGCGVFGGDVEMKFGIQLIAAASSKRDLLYHTFGDQELGNRLVEVEKLLRGKVDLTSAMQCVCDYCQVAEHPNTAPSFLQFLQEQDKLDN